MDKDNIIKEALRLANHPMNITGRRLWISAGFLGNVEMFAFANIGMTWEEVLMYNPHFNSIHSEEHYKQVCEFVNSKDSKNDKVKKHLFKMIRILDEVCDYRKYNKGEFKRVEVMNFHDKLKK